MISPSSVLQLASTSALLALKTNSQFNQVPILYIPQSLGSDIFDGIRLENSAYKVNAESAVSTQTLISINSDGTTNKQYITDNVAPGPRTWTISGWISSSEIMTAVFTATAIRGLDSTIRKQIDSLWNFFYSRGVGKFRDKDGKLWPYVVVASIDLDADPLTENKVPINITIKEINTISLSDSGVNASAVSNDPTSVYTPPQDFGQMVNTVIVNRDQILASIFS
jgi:hypothetical protein